MRKIIFRLLVLCMALMLPVMSVHADSVGTDIDNIINELIENSENLTVDNIDTAETITIAFKLGDSVLKINGEDVAVTTPFEENGTTLVPLRVITEAFGATVEWSDEEQSVTLTYDDVVIKIWIDRTDALVNGQKSALLLAPRLVNDTTMVPLRFITENFGADVSYDDATEAILVVKTASNGAISDYSSILHNTDKEYVGDSYYGWAMKASNDLAVGARSFDGRTTGLVSGDEGIILVLIENTDGADKDSVFNTAKKYAEGTTVAKQDEGKDSKGNDCITIEAKTSSSKLLIKVVITDDFVFTVLAEADIEGDADAFITLVKSFEVGVKDFSNTVDISEVHDNKRTYENKKLKFSMELPADWCEMSDSNVENEIEFSNISISSENFSALSVAVQSTDNMSSAEKWAQQEYEYSKAAYNPDYIEISDEVLDGTIGGIPSKYYTCTFKGDNVEIKDIFFEKGNYVYSFSFLTNGDGANMDEIINSVVINEIDFSEMGSLLIQPTGVSYSKVTDSQYFDFYAPSNWAVGNFSSGYVIVTNGISHILVDYFEGERADAVADYLYNSYGKTLNDFKKISASTYKGISGKSGYYASYSYTDNDGDTNVCKMFVFNVGGGCISVELNAPIELWGDTAEEVFEKVISTAELK